MENTIIANALPVLFILMFLAGMVGCFMVSYNTNSRRRPKVKGKKDDK